MKPNDYKFCLLYLLYVSKSNIIFLELKIDEYNSTSKVPSGLYEELLLATDRYFRIQNKLEKHFVTDKNIDKFLYMFEKQVCKA